MATKKTPPPIKKKAPVKKLPRATLDELFVERDGAGNVKPFLVESPLLGRSFLARPLTYGFFRADDVLSIPIMDWPLERKVDLLRDFMVEPSFKDLTVEKAQQFLAPQTIDHMIGLVVLKSTPFGKLQGGAKGISPLEMVVDVMKAAAIEKHAESLNTGSTS